MTNKLTNEDVQYGDALYVIINKINEIIDELNKRQGKFVKPTIKEIEEYCITKDNGVDAENFFNFYEAKGWMIGKNKMKDWKAAINTWASKTRPQEQHKSGLI